MIEGAIVDAVAATGVSAKELDANERESIVICLRDRLNVDLCSESPWDKLDAPDGILNPDGWKLIPFFVGIENCLLITASASVVWRLGSGKDLMLILQECPPFEFYVADIAFNYLVCFNHHDYLIGWGDARLWVNQLA
jgi:hypothetical protein